MLVLKICSILRRKTISAFAIVMLCLKMCRRVVNGSVFRHCLAADKSDLHIQICVDTVGELVK